MFPDTFDARTRPWYKEASSKRGAVITEPSIDITSNTLVVSSVMPLYGAKGELLGVLGLDVSLEELTSKIRAASIFNAGYGVLMAPSGLVL